MVRSIPKWRTMVRTASYSSAFWASLFHHDSYIYKGQYGTFNCCLIIVSIYSSYFLFKKELVFFYRKKWTQNFSKKNVCVSWVELLKVQGFWAFFFEIFWNFFMLPEISSFLFPLLFIYFFFFYFLWEISLFTGA